MKNHWVHKFSGYVRIKITGAYPEMFINRCIDSKIFVWDIRHPGKQTLVCSILLDEIPNLRKLARTSECKISFLERKGLPFLIKRLWKRNGLIVGAAGALILLYLLSNMVWNVGVDGASPKVEHELLQAVNDLGIKQGTFQFRLPPPEEIQSILTDEIREATWIGVTRKGTTYHFQVVEKDFAEREPAEAPGNLVAKRKAVIYDVFVEEGKSLIELNQVVQKGDLLVTGLIGREGEEEKVAARGKVYGEIWYKASVVIPLSKTLYAATGKRHRTHELYIGKRNIPVWGWRKPKFEQAKEESHKSSWKVFEYTLPFNYGTRDLLETEKIEVETAVENAIHLAKEKGARRVLLDFSKEAEIMDEKVLHHLVDNGKVKIIIHYRIVDEITMKQPITQGD